MFSCKTTHPPEQTVLLYLAKAWDNTARLPVKSRLAGYKEASTSETTHFDYCSWGVVAWLSYMNRRHAAQPTQTTSLLEMTSRSRRQQGFSLAELLIVLGLFPIAGGATWLS